MVIPIADRLAKFSNPTPEGCVLWTGRIDVQGYARIKVNGNVAKAHRVAYAHRFGEIPAGLVLHHKCAVKHCVNPDHLQPVTPREHSAIENGMPPPVTHDPDYCGRGHKWTPENTYWLQRKTRMTRHCRACGLAANKRSQARKKGLAA